MRDNYYGRPNDSKPVALVCSSFEQTGLVRHGFSTRLGGVSKGTLASLNLGLRTEDTIENVSENYSRFCAVLGVEKSRLILPRQVHSSEVKIVTRQDEGKGLARESDLGEFDAMITSERGLPLAVFYADCTPILFLDPVRFVVAAVHSGWRGTLARIGRKTVQMMQRSFGCRPENILAAFGPSIKQCHFEIDSDVFVEFCENFGTRSMSRSKVKGNKFYVDTDYLNRQQLIEEGLQEKNISFCNACTFCNNDIFYSHRADGGKTGRMCAVIELL